MRSGFFSVEACAAFLVLAVFLSAIGAREANSTAIMPAMQKANDLLVVWSQTGATQEEMEEDAELLFREGVKYRIGGAGELDNGGIVRVMKVFSKDGIRTLVVSVENQ